MIRTHLKTKGLILVNVLVFGFIVLIIVTSFITWAATLLKNYRQLAASDTDLV